MSAAAKAKTSVPSEGSFQTETNESKTNESRNSRQRNLPELKHNEAATRAKPVRQVSTETYDEKNEDNHVQQSAEDDDPCVKRKEVETAKVVETFRATPGLDPRFQQQNQTLRCFVMYTDFYRCEKILSEGHEACTWFRDVFTSICPNAWISRWDELRSLGRMPWSKGRTQGKFPGDRYGV